MAVSAGSVAVVATGVIFAYAGFKGKSVLASLQNVLQGKNPSSVAQSNTILGTNSSTTVAANTGTSSEANTGTSAKTTGSEDQWISAAMAAIGAPDNAANHNSMANWINHEGPFGTQGANNPLNSKLPMPGSTNFYQGVQNYPDFNTGIQGFAQTIEGGPFGDVLMALRSGQGLCGRSFAGLSSWSGGGYSQVC